MPVRRLDEAGLAAVAEAITDPAVLARYRTKVAASVHAHGRIYLIRITPGDHATYLAPGFYAVSGSSRVADQTN